MRDRDYLQSTMLASLEMSASTSGQLPRIGRGEGARVEEWLKFVRCNRRILDQLGA
ncbi:MAG TPA: hypothetical protein VIU61_27060 [Kofleriaceae bacterium]